MKNTEPKFSIVIPVHNNKEKLFRALRSVYAQTYQNYEIIVVDDHSDDPIPDSSSYKLIRSDERLERVACRNMGMMAAQGEWICWLDADDEYMSNYLEIVNDVSKTVGTHSLINFGSIIHWHRTKDEFITKIGQPFYMEPHMNFRSGTIGTGRFVFKRSCLDKVPLMTPCLRPYGDPGCFPELNRNPNYPMREDGQWVPIGNPFGEDYHWFWLLTRQYTSKTIDMLLYIEHRRGI